MGRLQFKRYCNPTAFRVVPPALYQELLSRFSADCRARHLDLSALRDDDASRKALEAFFTAPGHDLSSDLLRAMHEIDDLSDDDGHAALVLTAHAEQVTFPAGADQWDSRRLAIYCWLHHPKIFRSGADQAVIRKVKSFHDFNGIEARRLALPTQSECDALAASLKTMFVLRLLGESSEVRAYQDGDTINLIVSHGRAYRAEESLDGVKPGVVAYRPRKHDHVEFDNRTCRLRVNAADAQLVDAYRGHVGEVFFGDPLWFEGAAVVNLQPLKDKGAAALAPHGQVLSAKLVEIWLEHGAEDTRPTTAIYRSRDVFEASGENEAVLPQEGRPVYAVIELRFSFGGRAKRVQLEPPGKQQLPLGNCRDAAVNFLEHHKLLAGPPSDIQPARPPSRTPVAGADQEEPEGDDA